MKQFHYKRILFRYTLMKERNCFVTAQSHPNDIWLPVCLVSICLFFHWWLKLYDKDDGMGIQPVATSYFISSLIENV